MRCRASIFRLCARWCPCSRSSISWASCRPLLEATKCMEIVRFVVARRDGGARFRQIWRRTTTDVTSAARRGTIWISGQPLRARTSLTLPLTSAKEWTSKCLECTAGNPLKSTLSYRKQEKRQPVLSLELLTNSAEEPLFEGKAEER